jgi:hypothetical protein
MELILPKHVLDVRTPPDWFTRGLKDIDRALFVVWNPNRKLWVIARCLRDDNNLHEHDPKMCAQTLVLIVESEMFGGYAPLTERVLDKLRSMDMWQKHGSWENMTAETEAKEERQQAKIKQDQKEDIEHCSRDNRVQVNKMVHLIQQHDLRLNK